MDDHSPKPIAPTLDFSEDIPEPNVDPVDKNLAMSYFHPAWEQVEKLFGEEINSALQAPSEELVSEEYKIAGVSGQRTANSLIRILGRISDAVNAVESIEREQGGK